MKLNLNFDCIKISKKIDKKIIIMYYFIIIYKYYKPIRLIENNYLFCYRYVGDFN